MRHFDRSSRQRGFTYLWLMFAIAIAGAAAAAIGSRSSVATQREREAELAFRGAEIKGAIAAYWSAHAELPRRLDDLAEDRRGPSLQRHLRRVWTDPFTGRDDWVPVLADDGVHLRGVHSRAEVAAFDVAGLPKPAPGERAKVSQRLFVFTPGASAAAASAPTAAGSGSGSGSGSESASE